MPLISFVNACLALVLQVVEKKHRSVDDNKQAFDTVGSAAFDTVNGEKTDDSGRTVWNLGRAQPRAVEACCSANKWQGGSPNL